MELVGAAVALVTVAFVSRQAVRTRTRRRDSRLRDAEDLRLLRRAAAEDITRFGEELSRLHEETLTTRSTSRCGRTTSGSRRLRAREGSARSAAAPKDVTAVTTTLADGRFAQACVLAARDGRRSAAAPIAVLLRPRARARLPGGRAGRHRAASSGRSRSASGTPNGSTPASNHDRGMVRLREPLGAVVRLRSDLRGVGGRVVRRPRRAGSSRREQADDDVRPRLGPASTPACSTRRRRGWIPAPGISGGIVGGHDFTRLRGWWRWLRRRWRLRRRRRRGGGGD